MDASRCLTYAGPLTYDHKVLLAGYANPVLAVTGAVATGLNKRKLMAAAFRQRLGMLVGLLGGQAAGDAAPALVTLKLPLADAARVWRQQIGSLQSSVRKFAGTVKGERVQSLVLGGAIAMGISGLFFGLTVTRLFT